MSLKILSSLEPMYVDHIVLGLYSLPGLGKSTLGYTCRKPVLLDFDKGAHRAKNRKATVQVDSWDDVAEMTREDLAPFETIVVDTAGRALDYLAADIIESNPKKYGNGGGLSLQGFGVLKNRFTAWLKLMRTFGKDVVLIAHMDEKNEGDVVKERLDIQGSSKTEIYKCADAMAKLYIDGKDRMLDFSPREGSLGKNPAQLEILKVPSWIKDPNFLGDVIQKIKDNLNAVGEEAVEARKLREQWAAKFDVLKNVDEYNAILPEVEGQPSEIKILLVQTGEAHGLVFNKNKKKFEEAES